MAEVAQLLRKERDRADAGREPHVIAPHALYFAFLSYSHVNSGWGEWLHDALEKFRVPSSIAGRLTHQGVVPKRLTPIFRDRKELAASTDLGAELREAITASRYLIVLCSPAAANSQWTNAEIDTFKRVRPDGSVLAVVVDGEPFASDVPGREAEECLPPALRIRYDRRGRPTPKRAEPLCTDLRDDRDGKRLGLLKLVAGMLGVGLDDLVQRETVRRQRRLAILASASLAGMLITSALAFTAVRARDEAREQRRQAEGLVGFMLGDLKEKLEPIGRLDALDAVGSRALSYYQHQDKSDLSDEALAQRSKALTLMGEIAQTRGDTAGALSRYQEALASTAEAVRRYPDDPQRLFDHAQNVFYVGAIAYQRGGLDQAESAWREYQKLADRMVALSPDNKTYEQEQVYANTNVGTVLMDKRRYREAASAFQTALQRAESLAAAEPRNKDYQSRVINNLAWLADANESAGNIEQALGERERQLRLIADLQRIDPRDTSLQRDAMTSHRSIGRLLASKGDVAGGFKELQAGVTISDALFRIEPENTEWLQASAAGQFDLADLQLAAGRTADAAATSRSTCDIVDRLISRDGTVSDWKSMLRSRCLELRTRVALAQGDAPQAARLSRQWLAAARSSPQATDRTMLGFTALATGGDALAAAGNRAEATKWWTAASRAIPQSTTLRPSEQATLIRVKLEIGDRSGAQPLISSLTSSGYRHPAYVTTIRSQGVRQ